MFITSGPFSTTPLEEAGFHCPKFQLALRNPLKIAEFAHKVIQDGAKNLLEYGVLKSPIDTSRSLLNMVEGQLINIKKTNLQFEEAIKESLEKIPHGRYALIFVDDRDVPGSVFDQIKDLFCSRKEPQIFTGIESTSNLKTWLCEPQKRKNDICIIGTQHQCNGIETDIVVHIYPDDCPWCKISNTDPVIISRAMAMLIVATYQRVQCDCGWRACKEDVDHGWRTPQIHSDNEDEELESTNLEDKYQSFDPVSDSSINEEFLTESQEENQYLIELDSLQSGLFAHQKSKCKLSYCIVGLLLILVVIGSIIAWFLTRPESAGKEIMPVKI